jgi:hypothetical protein
MTATGTARRGRRDPSLLAPVPTTAPPTSVYVVGRKPLKFGAMTLVPGVEVPGASAWPRIEAWVNARAVRQVLADEDYIGFDTYAAMWAEEHPAELVEPEQTELEETPGQE